MTKINGTILDRILLFNLPVILIIGLFYEAIGKWKINLDMYLILFGLLSLYTIFDIITYKIFKKTKSCYLDQNYIFIADNKINIQDIKEIEYISDRRLRYSFDTIKLTYLMNGVLKNEQFIPKVWFLFIHKENPSLTILKKHFPELTLKIK